MKNLSRLVITIAMGMLLSNCGGSNFATLSGKGYSNVGSLNYGVVSLVEPDPDEAKLAGVSRAEYNTKSTSGMKHSSYCTGFYVSETEVMTAAHCVAVSEVVLTPWGPERIYSEMSPVGNATKVVTYGRYLKDPEMRSYTLFMVTKFNDVDDVALLTILPNQENDSDKKIFKIGAVPRLGDKSIVIGHPAGLMWTLTDGIISFPTRYLDEEEGYQKITQTSSPIYFGNSGGPLINSKGECIGVASKMIVPHLGMFAHVDSIRKMLNK